MIGKGLLHFVEDVATVDDDYYLKFRRNIFM